ncbi:MAG: TIGR00282 family metallophosphoesterase [Clostridia bacterium]|nr:TIGR00282 family metallophosphoesterase [Clostridia bacterium]MDD4798116.1 TIGR00282 family metallophosphoesterase [Clostridia bacterium]
MNILFIGDIFSAPGRLMVSETLPKLYDKYDLNFVIANGENCAGGFGLNKKSLEELSQLGVDCFTLGNHTWSNGDIVGILEGGDKRVVRPLNLAPGTPGAGYRFYSVGQQTVCVINLLGRTYMEPAENPFVMVNCLIKELEGQADYIIVDFHAEATSEKMAMGYFLDGRAGAVLGTHTHVQTNDARVLPRGTAYMTDVGMTGPRESILGVEKDIIIKRFLTGRPERFEPARGDLQFNGVIISFDNPLRVRYIEPLNLVKLSL